MSNIISFRARIEPKTVDKLLDTASEVHIYIHRLMAEARLTYGNKSDTFEYIREMLAGLESYINASSRYFEAVQDAQADLAITGNLPIEMLRERHKRLGERIAAYEKIHPRLVVAQLKQG